MSIHRQRLRFAGGVAVSALVLGFDSSAHADGSDPSLGSIVVFGDSMSDSGSYAGDVPPGAGKFTTNPDHVWVEDVAAGLGLPTLSSHAVGGTNYAEGGARVATPEPDAPGGLSRTPIVDQVSNFFTGGGQLNSNSLVIISGGGNDVLDTKFDGRNDTPADLKKMADAASALAGQVKLLKDAGAGTVVTVSVPDFDPYNRFYKADLAAEHVNVLFFDTAKLIAEIEANPSRYGILNTTDQACKVGPLRSFQCTPADYVTPNADKTYLYADRIHFTGAVQEMEAEGVLSAMLAPREISQLPYVTQSAGEAQSRVFAGQMDLALESGSGSVQPFFTVSQDNTKINDTPQQIGLGSNADAMTFGAAAAITPTASLGGAFTWSTLDGDFGSPGGGFEAQTYGVSVRGENDFGAVRGWLEADYNHLDFHNISRRIDIGPAVFTQAGSTTGEEFAFDAGASRNLFEYGLRITPSVSLRYDHTGISGYAEHGDASTQMTFGSQKLETLTAKVGVRLALADAGPVRPYVDLGYNNDLLDEDRHIAVTSNGAPVPWTSDAYKADGSYMTYGAGFTADVGERLQFVAGFEGVAARDGLDDISGFLSLRASF